MADITVWEMVKDAVHSIKDEVITRAQIKEYIYSRFGTVNPKTIDACISTCCVNMPARINAPENKNPRLTTGQYDFIYTIGRGQFTRYDFAKHGEWEIAVQEGHSVVRLANEKSEQKIMQIVEVPAIRRAMHKKHKQDDIQRPTYDVVLDYLKRWETLENYAAQERAINKLFSQRCPQNSDLDDVLVKVAALNTFYSTNIYAVFVIAKHIVSLDIDKRLSRGDESLVNDIATVKIGSSMKNFYSFATKYCCHHRPEDYPIFDSYVAKVLRYFSSIDMFAEFRDIELRDYAIFKRTLHRFKEYYSLTDFSLREIDLYLWQLGKEKFPNSYY